MRKMRLVMPDYRGKVPGELVKAALSLLAPTYTGAEQQYRPREGLVPTLYAQLARSGVRAPRWTEGRGFQRPLCKD